MKKRVLNLLSCLVIIISMLPITAYAAAGNMELKIVADKTTADPGDTITYTVYVGKVTNMQSGQFELSVPTGLTYVAGSGAAADGVKAIIGAAAVDWTERTQMFTFYGSGKYTGVSDTVLMSFQCTVDADASGSYTAAVENVVFGNNDYEEYAVTVTATAITVGSINDSQAETTEKRSEDTGEKISDSNISTANTEQTVNSEKSEEYSEVKEQADQTKIPQSEVTEQSSQETTSREAATEKEKESTSDVGSEKAEESGEKTVETTEVLTEESAAVETAAGGSGKILALCGISAILVCGICFVIYKKRTEDVEDE